MATGSGASSATEDLYKLLEVTAEATTMDVRASYRRLSQRYHPDKHVDPGEKQAASDHFTLVKEAYEILSVDKLRRIYNEFGLEAARSAASPEMDMVPYSDLVHRFRTQAGQGYSAGGAGGDSGRDAHFTVSTALEPRVDATGLMVALDSADPLPLFGMSWADAGRAEDVTPVVTQVGVVSHATAYVSQRDTLSVRYGLSGQTRRSRGVSGAVGDVNVTWRRELDGYTHWDTGVHWDVDDWEGRTVSTKVLRGLSNRMSMGWEMTYGAVRQELTTGLTCARSLSERCSASASWAFGTRSGFAFSWSRSGLDEAKTEEKREEMDEECETGQESVVKWAVKKVERLVEPMGVRWTGRWGVDDASVGVVVRRPVGEGFPLWGRSEGGGGDGSGGGAGQVRVSGVVGVMGWEVKCGWGRRFVVSDTEVGSSLGIGSIGVVWRIKVRRRAHSLNLPIILQSGHVDPWTAAAAAVVTACVTSAVELLIVQPWRERQDREARAQARAGRREDMERCREEAQESVRLMANGVQRVVERERAVEGGGLLVRRAVYGVDKWVRRVRVNDEGVEGREMETEMVEVGTAVQMLVDKSAVQVVSASKATLSGFWDPGAFGDKQELVLRVWYSFRGEPHDALVRDDEPLELPLSSHRVPRWT